MRVLLVVLLLLGLWWYFRKKQPYSEVTGSDYAPERAPVSVSSAAGKSEHGAAVDKIISDRYSVQNQAFIDGLNPQVKASFIDFIRDINAMGYEVVITSGYRSFQKQADLKKADSRNAAPGYSSHNYGTALDLVLVKDGKLIQKNAKKEDWLATGVPQLAKTKYGMRWGGDFAGYPDHVHFDYNNKYNTAKLLAAAIKKFGSAEKAVGNQLDLSAIV